MKLLALDLGTKLGFAIDTGRGVRSGTHKLPAGGAGDEGARFDAFILWLDTQWAAHGFDAVAFEQVHNHAGMKAAHIYGALWGVLWMWCKRRGITPKPVGVGVIKKAATGKGNASKADMIEAARRMGFLPIDDNEADAICLFNAVKRGAAD